MVSQEYMSFMTHDAQLRHVSGYGPITTVPPSPRTVGRVGEHITTPDTCTTHHSEVLAPPAYTTPNITSVLFPRPWISCFPQHTQLPVLNASLIPSKYRRALYILS